MGDTEAFYLTNCHCVVSENALNGGKVGVCLCARKRQRQKKNHKLKRLFLYPWQQNIPLLISALLLLITLRATDYILTLFISQWHLRKEKKKKKDRHAVITIFLRRTETHYSITIIFHLVVFFLADGSHTLVGNNDSAISRDLYVRLNKVVSVSSVYSVTFLPPSYDCIQNDAYFTQIRSGKMLLLVHVTLQTLSFCP